MPQATRPEPNEEALASIRARGAELAAILLDNRAPSDPLERLAFVAGAGSIERIKEAVDACRDAGWTWPQIAAAIGQNVNTVKTKYGAGYEAQRRYRDRKKAEG